MDDLEVIYSTSAEEQNAHVYYLYIPIIYIYIYIYTYSDQGKQSLFISGTYLARAVN